MISESQGADMKVSELRRILLPYADHVEIGVQDIATGDITDITGVRLVEVDVPDPIYGSISKTVLLISVHVWRRKEQNKTEETHAPPSR
jgi:hypothetical protein